jgi:hypothetical protein
MPARAARISHLAAITGPWHSMQRVGWQPSRFPANRAEAERAVALAEQLGRVNAAAAELGTTWPLLRKAFATALACQPRNPHAVRQRTIAAARRRSGRPPSLDPVFVALNPGALPAREWPAPSCMRGAPRRGVRHLGGPTWWSS